MNAYAPPALSYSPNLLDIVLNLFQVPTDTKAFEGLTSEERKKAYEYAKEEITSANDSFAASPSTLTESGQAAKQIQDSKRLGLIRKFANNGFDPSSVNPSRSDYSDIVYGRTSSNGTKIPGLAQGGKIAESKLTEFIGELKDSPLKTALIDLNKTDPRKAAQLLTQIAEGGEDVLKTLNAMEGKALRQLVTAGRLADVARETTFNPLLFAPNFASNSWNWIKTRFTKEDFAWKPIEDKKANLKILMDLAKTKPAATPSYQSVFKFGEEWKNASGFGARAGVFKDGATNLFSGGYKGFIGKTGNFGAGANLMGESMLDSVKGISSAAMSKSFVSTPVNWLSGLPPWGKVAVAAPILALSALGVRVPGVGNVADLCLGQGAGANLKAMTNCNPTKLGDNVGGLFKFALGNVLPFFAVPMIAAGLVTFAPVAGLIGAAAMATGAPAITTFLASAGINFTVGLTMNKFTETAFGNLPSPLQADLDETGKLIAEAERLTGQKIDSNSQPTTANPPNSPSIPNITPEMAAAAATLAKTAKV
jgi:hypothetical protein